jgi:hypothetical protein
VLDLAERLPDRAELQHSHNGRLDVARYVSRSHNGRETGRRWM